MTTAATLSPLSLKALSDATEAANALSAKIDALQVQLASASFGPVASLTAKVNALSAKMAAPAVSVWDSIPSDFLAYAGWGLFAVAAVALIVYFAKGAKAL